MSTDLQLGPCRIEVVSRGLLRIEGGSDQPAIIKAIEAAGGYRDGSRKCWWVETRKLGKLTRGLRAASDPLFASFGVSTGPESG